MALAAGDRLGPYEIISPLGAGGMGEVYRAKDPRLGRDVAIKVLPAEFSVDADRLRRFEQEARAAAALNHPNILTVHEIGTHAGQPYIVSELLEGQTLRGALGHGALPVNKAIERATQICHGLAAAHEKGIVHRDLKPENVFVTTDGRIKILDFGLAKLTEAAVAGAATMMATRTAETTPGLVMGTVGYMSPEQVRAQAVDHRSDIFSFGSILYEMLSGARAFTGDTPADTMSAILGKDPPELTIGRGGISSGLERIVRHCLERVPTQRFQSATDVAFALETVTITAEHPLPTTQAADRRVRWTAPVILAATAVVAAIVGWPHLRDAPAPSEPVRFQVFAPRQTTGIGSPVLSPDGRRLAFSARAQDGRRRLWIRSLDSVDARPLAGTEDVVDPVFWSPDSRFIGFAAGASLKKVDVTGKPPITLCDGCASSGVLSRGGAWSRDGIIVYPAINGLWRIPEGGGVPARVGAIDTYVGYPTFLPDGRHFLYTRLSGGSENMGIVVGSVDSTAEHPNSRLVIAGVFGSGYAPSRDPDVGYLLFVRDSTLMAQPFDPRRLALTGEAVPIAEHVPTEPMAFSASASATLAFKSSDSATDASKLAWFNREGKSLGLIGQPGLHGNVSFSPNGKRLVVDRIESNTPARHVWTIDVRRGVFSRVNSGRADDYAPAVSADGRVAFTSGADLYVTLASGAAQPELLFKSPTVKHANDWSPDGRFLLFDDHHATQQQDLWILPLGGDRKPIPLLVTTADEAPAHFSPDEKWVAYSSDESGRREIYVRDFAPDHVPAVGSGKWQISTAGGDKPRWRRDGNELYYIAPDGKLLAVAVKTTPTFEPAVPVPLFDVTVSSYSFFPYDVAADGRFLINTPADPGASWSTPITVVLNWMAVLKK